MLLGARPGPSHNEDTEVRDKLYIKKEGVMILSRSNFLKLFFHERLNCAHDLRSKPKSGGCVIVCQFEDSLRFGFVELNP